MSLPTFFVLCLFVTAPKSTAPTASPTAPANAAPTNPPPTAPTAPTAPTTPTAIPTRSPTVRFYTHTTVGIDKDAGYCSTTVSACPAPHMSANGTTSGMCRKSSLGLSAEKADAALREKMFYAARKETPGTAIITINNALAQYSWNKWDFPIGNGDSCATATCGKYVTPATNRDVKSEPCTNALTKFQMAYDTASGWDWMYGIPVWATATVDDSELTVCKNTVQFMLGRKIAGNYFMDSNEMVYVADMAKMIFICNNGPEVPLAGITATTIDAGAGSFKHPWSHIAAQDVCGNDAGAGTTLAPLKSTIYKTGGNSLGSGVNIERVARAIFNNIIPYVDPEGWRAFQKVAMKGATAGKMPYTEWGTYSWDCFTLSEKYFAAVLELISFNTRTNTYHPIPGKAAKPTYLEIATQDTEAFCLVRRWFMAGSQYSLCGTSVSEREQTGFGTVDCDKVFSNLGVTTKPQKWKDGSANTLNGVGGGIKTNNDNSMIAPNGEASVPATFKTLAKNNPWQTTMPVYPAPASLTEPTATERCTRTFNAGSAVSVGLLTAIATAGTAILLL